MIANGVQPSDELEKMAVERYFMKERKIRYFLGALSCGEVADPQGIIRLLKEELFPEEAKRTAEFAKQATEEFREFESGEKVLRISVSDPNGPVGKYAALSEQDMEDIPNVDEIHRINSSRRR